MLEHIGDDALVDRLIVLDYELAGGPAKGSLAEWRFKTWSDNDHQADFIERMCDLADGSPSGLELSEDQSMDLIRFSGSVLLLLHVIDLHDQASRAA